MHADEFDALSLADLADLREVWLDRERRRDLRAGQICYILAETNRDRDKAPRPFHPADFFPVLESMRPGPPSADELDSKLDRLFG